jgi:hypothetical protein
MKSTQNLPVAATLLFLIATCAAQSDNGSSAQANEAWGTSECSAAFKPQAVALGVIPPSFVSPASGYGTGGVALRNRGAGSLEISGVVVPGGTVPKAAFIYWAVLTPGAAPPVTASIKVQRRFPTVSPVVVLKGAIVGVGPSPCWPAVTTITVYKAAVPIPLVATGNGLYEIKPLPGAAGSIDGSDPFLVIKPPLWEGASMVIVGFGAGTVSIYDAGLAGATFVGGAGLTYTLALPVAAPGVKTLIDNIGADGQHGPASRVGIPPFSAETTTINGFPTAGPGSGYNDSDWNGSSGFPMPELWDDTGHDITPATPAGTPALGVAIVNGADCLTPVANVVETD